MDTSIVISLILGVSSIITSIFYGYIPTKRAEAIRKKNHKILILYKDIDSLNDIEDLLLNELCKSNGENKESVKRRIRKSISDKKGFPLSELRNPSNVKKEIERYSCI